jgi:hypothetical protein
VPISRMLVVPSIVVFLSGFGFLSSAPASADQVWHQSVVRVGPESACPSNSLDETSSGWSRWHGGWELWPNKGTGGFTCSRSIVWAKETSSRVVTCVANSDPISSMTLWWDFGDSYFLPGGTHAYLDATCVVLSEDESASIVNAPASSSPTDVAALCLSAFGPGRTVAGPWGDIWSCEVPDG